MAALLWWPLAALLGGGGAPARATADAPVAASLLYAPYQSATPELLAGWLDLVEELTARGEGRVVFETLDRSRAEEGDFEREAAAGVTALPAVILHPPTRGAPRVWQGGAVDLADVRAALLRYLE